jgi:hypothetical protein
MRRFLLGTVGFVVGFIVVGLPLHFLIPETGRAELGDVVVMMGAIFGGAGAAYWLLDKAG